jgi:L-Lysine epsilon oxidase N-terminal
VTTHLFSRREFIASLSATAVAASGFAWVQPVAAQQLSRIRRVAIHPAIGVARVGNSRDAMFFGPEVPGALPAGPFKDPAGAVAKQAARFRIFRL